MSNQESSGGVTRRALLKSTALGSLALAAGGLPLPFTLRSAAAAVQQAAGDNTRIVWGACSVNCGSRCALRLHVRDDEVVYVETDNTGDDRYGDHQVRACLRGRSIRRRINHPDRLNYPMKRVGKRGEGKFERISWQEALDTLADRLKRVVAQYGNEAVYINYSSGIVGGNMTRSSPSASPVARLMNCYGGSLNQYGTYSTAQIACAMPYTYGSNDGNSGARESTYTITIERLPVLENPVKTAISCFTWTDAIARGPEMTATRDGVRGKEKLDVPIKFLWNYAGNTLINQHSDINKTHEILLDESKCETIVVIDNFMTSSAKYADLLLPDLMTVEQEDIIPNDYAGNMGYLIFIQPATSAKFERKPIYWILSEVAKRLGDDVYQRFTEGRTQAQWLQHLYAKMVAKDPALPAYDELKRMGIYKRKDPDGHFVAYRDFRRDPEAHPLKTPSGKIEIYSSRLAEIAARWQLEKDEVISPLPVYASTFEGWDDPLRSQYPLQLFGFHYKARTHSSYGNVDVLQAACRQEVWINPLDAAKRGIKNGDLVRVFNQRGEVRLPAKVTPRIMPGVSAMGQGAWHDANMAGDRVDHGACMNTLTTHRPSPLAKGNPQHTNLVDIEKV
ncbi:molybdopterin-dependent oxidoreductase [Klebsiella quasipneumoniae]|uniref:molybdopterin-dependent oxidoreductase n=1 Tax=Klebsiella quasipneumoniae TaxID=1463165 RepID=UPI000F1404B4|nr:molybdopterin-dependent oxidoreductase [Klebsiella quasipneumoniae]MBZ7057575.1 molybdopterin-dependent oxidoreductase [Klebsiella quasipneumoniae]VCW94083.1 Putative dimethyl sulfoxide reductase chain YnfE [Klebsiella quasipneumoniae]